MKMFGKTDDKYAVSESLVVGITIPHEDSQDRPCIVVTKRDGFGGQIDIINAAYGEEAIELYERLINTHNPAEVIFSTVTCHECETLMVHKRIMYDHEEYKHCEGCGVQRPLKEEDGSKEEFYKYIIEDQYVKEWLEDGQGEDKENPETEGRD